MFNGQPFLFLSLFPNVLFIFFIRFILRLLTFTEEFRIMNKKKNIKAATA